MQPRKTYGFPNVYHHMYSNIVLAGRCLLKAYFHLHQFCRAVSCTTSDFSLSSGKPARSSKFMGYKSLWFLHIFPKLDFEILGMRSSVRKHRANTFPCKYTRHFHLTLQWFLFPCKHPFSSNCIPSFCQVEHLFYKHF